MTGMDDRLRGRLTSLALVVAILFGVLFTRLWSLQVLSGATFEAQAENNHVRIVWLEAPRGRVLDRNGKVLVKNRPALAVGVRREDFPKDARRARALKTRLASLVRVSVAQIDRRLADRRASPFQPIVIAEDIPVEAYFEINERQDEFPGVETLEIPVREYPYGTTAAHLLGYVNEITEPELERRRDEGYRLGDSIGRTGIERTYESFLRGTPELRKLEVNASGRVLGILGGTEPIPGKDVQLTIDVDVQRVAERALVEGIARARQQTFHETGRRFRAPAGAAVVLDAKTGEVVAMASYPTYDPRRFVGGVSEQYYSSLNDPKNSFPLLNRAVQAAYPPGSTFKPVVAIGAMASGIGSASGSYPCLSAYRFGDRVFRNWQPRNARISIAQSLVESCDTVYYEFAVRWWRQERAAEQAGRTPGEIMQAWARRFGFGSKTGIDVPSEAAGRIPDRAWRRAMWEANKDDYCKRYRATRDPLFEDLCERGHVWRPGDSINMSIGQGDVQVTPLQLAVSYAAIANGGTLVTPHVGKQVLSRDGDPLERIGAKPRGKVTMPSSALRYVQRALVRTSEDGTARFPYRQWPLDRIAMAAKTGSAEIAGKQPFSWFASYGPADDPRYVAVAVVEEAGAGSQVSGPIVRRIMDELFDQPPLPIVFGTRSD